MPTFTYSARPASGGDLRTGEVELRTKDEVVSYLRRQRLESQSWSGKSKRSFPFPLGLG